MLDFIKHVGLAAGLTAASVFVIILIYSIFREWSKGRKGIVKRVEKDVLDVDLVTGIPKYIEAEEAEKKAEELNDEIKKMEDDIKKNPKHENKRR